MKKLLVLVLSLLITACGSDITLVDLEPEVIHIDHEIEVPVYGGDVWVEHFYQLSSTNGTDILWVVDFSCSMQNQTQQDKLAAGIAAMMNALPPSGWRLNMISSDPYDAEVEEQFPLVPGDNVDHAIAMLNAISQRQREEGLQSSWEYFNGNPYAETWLREDATLLTVFVSDEQDQSEIAWQDWLYDYKLMRPPGAVFASAIINPDLPQGYRDVVTALGGIELDVSSDDWAPGMAQATAELEPYEEWVLEYTPYSDSVIVFEDGVEFTDWYYDSSTNTVYFDTLPREGALVEIGYVIEPSE